MGRGISRICFPEITSPVVAVCVSTEIKLVDDGFLYCHLSDLQFCVCSRDSRDIHLYVFDDLPLKSLGLHLDTIVTGRHKRKNKAAIRFRLDR